MSSTRWRAQTTKF